MERIFFSDWIYVCHTSQLSEVGDTLTFDIDRESIVVCRDEQMQLRAFANVCRHRGSRICQSGPSQNGVSNNKRLVCPYHAWTYGLDGKILSTRLMPEGFDKSAYDLKQLALEIFLRICICQSGRAARTI